jgi:hypothetical protein
MRMDLAFARPTPQIGRLVLATATGYEQRSFGGSCGSKKTALLLRFDDALIVASPHQNDERIEPFR